MQITVNANMIVGIVNAWAKRNLENEGLVVDTYAFDNNEIVITFKAEEPEEEIVVE